MRKRCNIWAALLAVVLCFSTATFAQVVKEGTGSLDSNAFRDDSLMVKSYPVSFAQVKDQLPNLADWKAFTLNHGPSWDVYIDLYSGLPANVMGIGIDWVPDGMALPMEKLDTIGKEFISTYRNIFQAIDPSYLQINPSRSGYFGDDNYLTFIDFDVVYQGVPIKDAHIVFRCNHGRMVQFGTEGVLPENFTKLDPYPALSAEQAQFVAFDYAGGFDPKTDTLIEPGNLFFMPRILEQIPSKLGDHIDYPLVWEVSFKRAGEKGTWTAHVDAHSGQVLEFYDSNAYGSVKGGVYEVSQSESSETLRPMPFADVQSGVYADSSGKYSIASGSIRTYLQGKYVKISDNCGSINLTGTAPNDLNLGTSGGTDCTTPGVGGSGNTHASRSCYYHVSRVNEKARSFLSRTWLNGQVTANMNINDQCNAYWDGSAINFFRSGGGCGNTGEIAAIFLHEWGHGLDSNDGSVSGDYGTGETYGDTMAFLQTHDSCVGPGFLTSNCSGYGDSCTSCTGVRDVDYNAHSSHSPHTIGSFVKNSCPTDYSYKGPCGKEGHCESYPLSEAMWDIANRDLGFDIATNWYILDRLYFLTRPTSGSGYTCSNYVASGCGSSNWHTTFLVADDNDGNLSNGTPHSKDIYDAFNRHGVACSSYNYNNSPCSTTPTKPSISATAGDNSVSLSFSSSGASSYYILRNDFGCDKGYIKVGSTTSTTYTDTTVANGFTYYYRILAVGSNASCFSELSDCKTVTPQSGGGGTTYSISGTISASGSGISGVAVAYSGPSSGSVSTATDGTYTISGLANGTYTLTPTKSGYTFTPSSLQVVISGANKTGQNFTGATQQTETELQSGVGLASSVAYQSWIYFYVTVPSGATNLEIKTTNASADVDLYTRQGSKPTSSTYTCRPYSSSGNETCTQANPTAGTWWAGVYGYAAGSFTITATVTTPSETYSISGTVSGAITSGVTMTLTGAASATTTTASGGTYTFSSLSNGTYTVTPSASGYTFTPSSLSVTINGANQTGKNFTSVSSGGGGDPVLQNGVGYNDTMTASTRQAGWNYYTFTTASGDSSLGVVLSNLTKDLDLYVKQGAKPTSSSYDCRPYTSGTTSETCNFASPTAGTWYVGVNNWDTGTSMPFRVTATWTTSGGGDTTAPTTSITSSQCGTTITTSSTTFTWTGSDNVTPTGSLVYSYRIDSGSWSSFGSATSKSYTGLSNASHTFEVKARDAAGNEDATPATCTVTVNVPQTTYSISGTVSGAVASGVTITLSGAASNTTTTDTSGNYSFSGLSNGSYTVTPSRSGYTFSPTSRSVTISGANQTGQNFTSSVVSGDTQLTSGVAVGGSVSQGAYKYYYITVPSGATSLTVDLTGLSADVDLYTKFNAKPTTSSYDGRSWNGGTTSEQIVQTSPTAGTWWIGVYGYAAGSYTVKATVVEGGGGGGSCSDLTASFNSSLGAPACTTAGASCNAPATLLQCAGNDEPGDQNNTLGTCTDGTSGSCHSDESVESIKVATTGGGCLTTGQEVRVDFSVYCYSNADYVKLYYATSASSPTWTLLAGTQCDGAGAKDYYYNFNLSGTAGSTQALRVQIVYNADPGTNACYSGNYNDRDDLVFATSGSTLTDLPRKDLGDRAFDFKKN
ncbi:MAG TPA: pre-peptidase C-terminal domain-containing protein [Thermoanaerobaculia bacterium]|nr:pre-peptidase C-terminal domain-containing protein [Thermoanaerobaculia bacterium]HUM28755.1 pre-peptidase C-terminal domain-containing protein [Thermoanaerobaculia bacterium]HXK67995.1 pre-peptidase C-terminal domain-containing protein [Thermoanaerobaculia bacterium]